jgi:hypothetical protein
MQIGEGDLMMDARVRVRKVKNRKGYPLRQDSR